jgi:hypothetical protein
VSYISLYEGDSVAYLGDGRDGLQPASGTLVYFASDTAANVKWSTGPRQGEIDMVSIYDLVPEPSQAALHAPTLTTMSVRMVMGSEGEQGVINLLARANRLANWERIARDVLNYVEARLKVDTSLDLAYEQLSSEQMDRVVSVGARRLLRDAFGEEPT